MMERAKRLIFLVSYRRDLVETEGLFQCKILRGDTLSPVQISRVDSGVCFFLCKEGAGCSLPVYFLVLVELF